MKKDKESTGIPLIKDEYTSVKSILNDFVRATRSAEYIFRGVSKREQVNPTIARLQGGSKKSLIQCEFSLLSEFIHRSSFLLTGNLDCLDFVSYAQHFGLPTRLIDWTRSPFIALFFAINREPTPDNGSYRLYYTLKKDHFIVKNAIHNYLGSTCTSMDDLINNYYKFINLIKKDEAFKEAFKNYVDNMTSMNINVNGSVENGLLLYEGNQSNPRLIAQQGLFSIPRSIECEDAIYEIEQYCSVSRIFLEENERLELLGYLRNMNISKIQLFPDLQNIAEEIKRTHIESLSESNFFIE